VQQGGAGGEAGLGAWQASALQAALLSAGLPLAGERSGWGSLFLCPCPTHRQPEGAKRARVTQLPSTKLLEQQLSRRHAVSVSLLLAVSPKHWSSSQAPEASLLTFFHSFSFAQWRTPRARSLEALLEGQAKVRLAAFHPPLAVPGCQVSRVTFCRRVVWCHSRAERVGEHRECQHVLAGGAGMKLAVLGREPVGQSVPAVPRSGCWCHVAARWWPFVLQGCCPSTAWFLQGDAKRGPAPVPSVNGGGRCRSAGESWKAGQGGPCFLLAPALLQKMGCCCGCPSPQASRSPSLCSRRELSPRGPFVPP